MTLEDLLKLAGLSEVVITAIGKLGGVNLSKEISTVTLAEILKLAGLAEAVITAIGHIGGVNLSQEITPTQVADIKARMDKAEEDWAGA